MRKHIYLRAPLTKTIAFDAGRWVYWFSGITIRQHGFGVIWRESIEEPKVVEEPDDPDEIGGVPA